MLGEWNDKMTRKSNSKAFLSNKSNFYFNDCYDDWCLHLMTDVRRPQLRTNPAYWSYPSNVESRNDAYDKANYDWMILNEPGEDSDLK